MAPLFLAPSLWYKKNMPHWIHDRAEHIMAKNPAMEKGEAFAIATQQSHALGKSPKGFGTPAARTEAKEKYPTPKDDKKTANPGNLAAAGMESTVSKTATIAFYDELAKLGAITDEHARRAIDQLDSLEQNKPTLGQVGRYAALGAAAGPVIGAIGNAIRGGAKPGTSMLSHLAGAAQPGFGPAARALAGGAVTGAIGSGLVPLVRGQLDRHAAMSTLNGYIAERAKEQSSPMMKGEQEPVLQVEPKVGSAPEAFAAGIRKLFGAPKMAFQVSQYSGPLSYGAFKQESKLPPFHAPSLAAPVEKKAAPTTPAGLLSMSRGVGYPKITTPGGSIAEIAKPKGFGKPLAGATNPNSLLH